MKRRHSTGLAGIPGLAAALALCGCGAPPPREPITSFAAAEKSGQPATVEGIPVAGSLRRETGKPATFRLREEASANEVQFVAPEGVTVPANFPSADYVVVTGQYDAQKRQFVATDVRTKVPTRDTQAR